MMESSGIQKSNKGARRGRQGEAGEAAERYQVVQVKGRLASLGSYMGPLQDVFKTREGNNVKAVWAFFCFGAFLPVRRNKKNVH